VEAEEAQRRAGGTLWILKISWSDNLAGQNVGRVLQGAFRKLGKLLLQEQPRLQGTGASLKIQNQT
jgi:hypothetical protein